MNEGTRNFVPNVITRFPPRDGTARSEAVIARMRASFEYSHMRRTYEAMIDGTERHYDLINHTRNAEVRKMNPKERLNGAEYFYSGFRWCCGVGEYYGINLHDAEQMDCKVIIEDLLKNVANSYKAAIMLIEALPPTRSPLRLQKLQTYIKDNLLGELQIVDLGINPNSSKNLWLGIFKLNQEVISLILTFSEWSPTHKAWLEYGKPYKIKEARDKYEALLQSARATQEANR